MTSDGNVKDLENLIEGGKWSSVLKLYKEKRELRTTRMAKGETILHKAMSSGKESVAESMVNFVCGEGSNKENETSALLIDENGDEKKLVLGAMDVDGITPLHLASSKGYTEMCRKIGGAYPFLIAHHNNTGATPLCMAALYGKKRAFLWLHYLYTRSPGVSSTDLAHCIRRDDNDSILYCALDGEHVDVAVEIVFLYEDNLKEMIMHKKNGVSLLHLLAVKPSVFESTELSDQSFVVQFIYHWFVRVKKKEQATTREELKQPERKPCFLYLARAVLNCAIKLANNEEGSSWAAKIRDLIVILLCLLAFLLLFPLLIAEYWFHNIRTMKEKHTWYLQILEKLLQHASDKDISAKPDEKDGGSEIVKTPLMIAAENGVKEMVTKIFDEFPSTMKDVNDEGRNIVLLAAEKRQTKLYQTLCQTEKFDESLFNEVDNDGNTALHLAAKPGVHLNWQTTTMVEEFKWFKFVKRSMNSKSWEKYKKDGKTAEDVFIDSYKEHMKSDREWLDQTSQAGSVVSTLVASIAFSNVTGNFNKKKTTHHLWPFLCPSLPPSPFWAYLLFVLNLSTFGDTFLSCFTLLFSPCSAPLFLCGSLSCSMTTLSQFTQFLAHQLPSLLLSHCPYSLVLL